MIFIALETSHEFLLYGTECRSQWSGFLERREEQEEERGKA